MRALGETLLLIASLSAQTPLATLQIPAGTWTVRDLLTQAEHALDTPIAADAAELARAAEQPVRLQFPMTLDATFGREAVAALLSTRGLLLVEDAQGRCEVKATPRGAPAWLRQRAADTTVPALFDCPHRDAVVHLELASPIPPELLHTRLRGAAGAGATMPIVEPGRAGIVITGTAETVRHAVTTLAAMDPEVAMLFDTDELLISIVNTAKGGTVELQAGEHRIQDVVDLLAANAGINIVLSPAVAASTTTLAVAAAQRLD